MKKGSLAAKLRSVMKVHRSEMALREHRVAAGDEEEEELYLLVAEVVKRDAFMTELRDRIQSVCMTFSLKMVLLNYNIVSTFLSCRNSY